MKLTQEQKAEIKDYIIGVPKYRETYNELYDHILNSLEDNGCTYSINEVTKIIYNDFGGFSEIVNQEKIYQRELGKKYNKSFRMQFFNTFKRSCVLLLAFCLVIYFSNKTIPFNTKPMLMAITICFIAVAIFSYAMIVRNRIKYAKYSILDNYLGIECIFGMGISNMILHGFVNGEFFNLSDNGKLIAMLSLFFFSSMYVRTFIIFYNQKFKVLAV